MRVQGFHMFDMFAQLEALVNSIQVNTLFEMRFRKPRIPERGIVRRLRKILKVLF